MPHSLLPRVVHRVSSFLVSLVDLWELSVLLRGLALCHVMSFTKLQKRSPYKLPKFFFNFYLMREDTYDDIGALLPLSALCGGCA